MNRRDSTPDHNFNDDPFRKELGHYDYQNRAHEPGYSNPRNARFDYDYGNAVDGRMATDNDSFLNPMEDILDRAQHPRLVPNAGDVRLPGELSRALERNPEAMTHFHRLSTLRQRQIVNALSRGESEDRRREHVHNIVQKLLIESRKDTELGQE